MRARAPGKVVISGAYSVLEGAPALASAVDRYVEATSDSPASFMAPEVACALQSAPYQTFAAPNYDAGQLRKENRKLGLGSSAAILLSSLACLPPTDIASEAGRERLFALALDAHRRAQGGGSGIDVACSCFGGTLCYQLDSDGGPPRHAAVELPTELYFEVWASEDAASTSHFVAEVHKAKQTTPEAYHAVLSQLRSGAEDARRACTENDAELFLSGLRRQAEGFSALGQISGLAIETPSLKQLSSKAEREGAIVMPAGAGGGDIALWVGPAPPSAALLRELPRFSHGRLDLRLGAKGVHWV